MEFGIILPPAKIAKLNVILSLLIATLDNINLTSQWKCALKRLIYGNNAT